MASAIDTFSDLDISDSDEERGELDTLFNLAADHVKVLVNNLESSQLLEIYGLFKQATNGPCNTPRPSWYEMQAKQKWDAWDALKDMSQESAKTKYIKLIQEIDPKWNNPNTPKEKTGQQWVTVSSMIKKPDNINENEKTVFDFCRDGNVNNVEMHLKTKKEAVSELESGLGLIHWAVDRGHTDMVSMLLKNKCDVSMRDESGQTPLHYATSCGHADCVTVLLEYGADKTLMDEDGMTPLDCATDDVKHLLQ